jgi:hypothetical protein
VATNDTLVQIWGKVGWDGLHYFVTPVAQDLRTLVDVEYWPWLIWGCVESDGIKIDSQNLLKWVDDYLVIT